MILLDLHFCDEFIFHVNKFCFFCNSYFNSELLSYVFYTFKHGHVVILISAWGKTRSLQTKYTYIEKSN